MKVLIIEDDPLTVESLSLAFEFRWSDVTLVSTGKGAEGVGLAESESPDIVILDLGLPDVDGMEVLRDIRQFSDVPVIIITGRAEDSAIVRGLEAGADDYITKPFDAMVMLARVKSVLSRTRMPELRGKQSKIIVGRLTIDFAARRVTLDGNPVALTATEWALLSELVRNEGKVVSLQGLAGKLWGEDAFEYPSTLRSYITRLRAKLGDSAEDPKTILTERGTGYRFVMPTS